LPVLVEFPIVTVCGTHIVHLHKQQLSSGASTMGPKQRDLTHEEIWDDSVLVDSWNDALKEYKVCPPVCSLPDVRIRLTYRQKYHSIHRNGGNVEDLVRGNNKYGEVLFHLCRLPLPKDSSN
jgi:hypothetical protein